MKTKTFKTITTSLLTVALLITASCDRDPASTYNEQTAPVLSVSPDGTSSIVEENMLNILTITSNINSDETSFLIKMREEEKLARDVYYALSAKWGNIIFTRISGAENNHMNAVNTLLKYYSSNDTLINEVGVFADAAVQELYNKLVFAGSASLTEAFKTGAMIEEMDIKDLQDLISTTGNENIIMIFNNLERGSRNHLRAFSRQLKTLGISYVPVYLSPDEYKNIISTTFESGNRYRVNYNASCKNMKRGW